MSRGVYNKTSVWNVWGGVRRDPPTKEPFRPPGTRLQNPRGPVQGNRVTSRRDTVHRGRGTLSANGVRRRKGVDPGKSKSGTPKRPRYPRKRWVTSPSGIGGPLPATYGPEDRKSRVKTLRNRPTRRCGMSNDECRGGEILVEHVTEPSSLLFPCTWWGSPDRGRVRSKGGSTKSTVPSEVLHGRKMTRRQRLNFKHYEKLVPQRKSKT